jgi:uncharacterized cupin superfamily protein
VADDNIWTDEWDSGEDWSGGGGESKRLPRGSGLGATVYELGPGDFGVYHFHHASEELLIMLRGRDTLRTPDGEREVAEGEVVHFPAGPEGAHGTRNDSDARARFLMVSTLRSPEVVEYPDLKQITAQGRTLSQTGEALWLIHDLASRDDGARSEPGE